MFSACSRDIRAAAVAGRSRDRDGDGAGRHPARTTASVRRFREGDGEETHRLPETRRLFDAGLRGDRVRRERGRSRARLRRGFGSVRGHASLRGERDEERLLVRTHGDARRGRVVRFAEYPAGYVGSRWAFRVRRRGPVRARARSAVVAAAEGRAPIRRSGFGGEADAAAAAGAREAQSTIGGGLRVGQRGGARANRAGSGTAELGGGGGGGDARARGDALRAETDGVVVFVAG